MNLPIKRVPRRALVNGKTLVCRPLYPPCAKARAWLSSLGPPRKRLRFHGYGIFFVLSFTDKQVCVPSLPVVGSVCRQTETAAQRWGDPVVACGRQRRASQSGQTIQSCLCCHCLGRSLIGIRVHEMDRSSIASGTHFS